MAMDAAKAKLVRRMIVGFVKGAQPAVKAEAKLGSGFALPKVRGS